MKKEEFRTWLKNVDGRNAHQASDHVSRIKRIEKEVSILDGVDCDVEVECQRDQCEELMAKLLLSNRKKMPEHIGLPETPMGMSRLRSSLRKYIDFYKWRCSRNK
jgi:hypothetical protein